MNKDNWYQIDITPCPVKGCKGMLLVNDYTHTRQCSDCKKLFIEITEWIDIESMGGSNEYR